MQDFDMEWVEELRQQTENHMLYEPLDRICREREPKFMEILESLPQEQAEWIRQYVKLLEKRNIQLTTMSYLMGIQVGERRARKRENPFL